MLTKKDVINVDVSENFLKIILTDIIDGDIYLKDVCVFNKLNQPFLTKNFINEDLITDKINYYKKIKGISNNYISYTLPNIYFENYIFKADKYYTAKNVLELFKNEEIGEVVPISLDSENKIYDFQVLQSVKSSNLDTDNNGFTSIYVSSLSKEVLNIFKNISKKTKSKVLFLENYLTSLYRVLNKDRITGNFIIIDFNNMNVNLYSIANVNNLDYSNFHLNLNNIVNLINKYKFKKISKYEIVKNIDFYLKDKEILLLIKKYIEEEFKLDLRETLYNTIQYYEEYYGDYNIYIFGDLLNNTLLQLLIKSILQNEYNVNFNTLKVTDNNINVTNVKAKQILNANVSSLIYLYGLSIRGLV